MPEMRGRMDGKINERRKGKNKTCSLKLLLRYEALVVGER